MDKYGSKILHLKISNIQSHIAQKEAFCVVSSVQFSRSVVSDSL